MAKLKDGFYKLTAEAIGNNSYMLLAGGGSKALSDFATASGVVTALGTNGNYVTWTKNGTVNNLTVPYATNADKVDGYHADSFLQKLRRTNLDISSSYSGMVPPDILSFKNGYPVYTDPEFASGKNSISVYNNSGGSAVTITREASTTSGNSSGYCLHIKSAASGASPNGGGWYFSTGGEVGRVSVCVFRANIPSGYSVEFHSNSTGSGSNTGWLTSTSGTGKYEWYAYMVEWGSDPSSTFFFTLNKAATVDWYLSYANVINISNASYDGLRTRYSDYATSADTVDGYHASSFWRSDGATWNPTANITMTPTSNGQEWSFDFRNKGSYTGSYWHVWDESKNTLLRVDADSGAVSAPYGFVGNLTGTASTASGAYYVFDYNATTTPIYIGFVSTGLTSATASHLAAYGTTSSGARCIKDISATEAKKFIGLGNVQNAAFYKRVTTVNGTTWNMAGTTNDTAFTIYAPTTAGSSGQVLTSTAGTPGWINLSSLNVGNADTVDNLHASDFVKITPVRFSLYKKGIWTKILTFTITNTSIDPSISFSWHPTECSRYVWADFNINIRSGAIIFMGNWKGSTIRTLKCVGDGTTYDVWVSGTKDSYDPYGAIQITSTYKINSYNTGSLAYQDSEPTGTYSANVSNTTIANYANSAGSVAWANVSGKPSFAAVATSGSYNDLSNKPTIPTSLPANGGTASKSEYLLCNALTGTAAFGLPHYGYTTLNEEFGTTGTDTTVYLQNYIKKLIKTHNSLSSRVGIGSINPNSSHLALFRAYTLSDYNSTGLPLYCTGFSVDVGGYAYVWGTSNGTWFKYSLVSDKNVDNYYWANVRLSTSSNDETTPTFSTATTKTKLTTPLVSSTGRLTLNATSTSVDLKFNNDNTKSVILNGAAFKPFNEANNKLTLGSSSARWSELYSVKGNFTGLVKINGTAASQPLLVRNVTGQDGTGSVVGELYLQYGANKAIMLGNTGAHSISADGSYYTGNAASATTAENAKNLTSKTPQLADATESNKICIVDNVNSAITTNNIVALSSIRKAIDFKWYDTHWQIGNIRGGSSGSDGFGVTLNNDTLCFRVTASDCYVGSNTILHSGNSSVSKSGQTLTVKINGVEQSLTNTTYTSLKNPNAIKFKKTDGTTVTYDGSSAADLTAGVNYATSAGSANKLTTARTITLGGDFTGSVSFNGSSDITINTYNKYSFASKGGVNNKPYCLIAQSGTATGSWVDKSIILDLEQGYISGSYGRIKIELRTENVSEGKVGNGRAFWIFRKGFEVDSVLIGIRNTSGATYVDVFYKCPGTYSTLNIRQVGGGSRGSVIPTFTLVSSSESSSGSSNCWDTIANAATALHNQAYTSISNAVDDGAVNYANSAGIATGAYYVFDYNATTTPIYIGFVSTGLTSATASHLAAYGTTSSGARCIKDISATEAKKFIGLGNVQNAAFYKRVTTVNGTTWNMAGTTNDTAFTIYAPTTAGTSNYILKSNGTGAPIWISQSDLSVGNSTNWSRCITWKSPTTVNTWSKVLKIKKYSNVLLTVNFSQSSQASQHLYLISTGHDCARIVLLGANKYSSHFDIQIRITQASSTEHHVEIYNTYGHNSATTVTFDCRALNMGISTELEGYTTYTEGSGTVKDSLISHHTISRNLAIDRLECIEILSTSTYNTVAKVKTRLEDIWNTVGRSVGSYVVISSTAINNWDTNTASVSSSSSYAMIKIGGAYEGNDYGLWLLSTYGDNKIGYVGRSGDTWTNIKWLATTDLLDPLYTSNIIMGTSSNNFGQFSYSGSDLSRHTNLTLGNNIAYNTSGKAWGSLKIYGRGTGATTIRRDNETTGDHINTSYSLYLPKATGEIVHHPLGTKIGSETHPVYINEKGLAIACNNPVLKTVENTCTITYNLENCLFNIEKNSSYLMHMSIRNDHFIGACNCLLTYDRADYSIIVLSKTGFGSFNSFKINTKVDSMSPNDLALSFWLTEDSNPNHGPSIQMYVRLIELGEVRNNITIFSSHNVGTWSGRIGTSFTIHSQ